jgi:hypothetical protein
MAAAAHPHRMLTTMAAMGPKEVAKRMRRMGIVQSSELQNNIFDPSLFFVGIAKHVFPPNLFFSNQVYFFSAIVGEVML